MTAAQANQAQVVSDAMLEALSRRDLLGNNNNNNGGQGGLRPQDIGYFHPEAEDDKGYGVISDAKATKYTDVHAFCQQLKHLEATHSTEAVRRVWTQCLLGTARVWYSHVLSDVDRDMLDQSAISTICAKLKERFRTGPTDKGGRKIRLTFFATMPQR
jgi:hypothetical protein